MSIYIEENYLGSFKIKLDSSFVLDRHIIEKGVWELHIIQMINTFLRPGNICIDVGANAGYHTIAMAGAVGSNGHVYAFEPNQLTYSKLIDNIALNPTLKSRVTCEKVGLSDSSGTLKVFQAGEDLGNAYVSSEYREDYWNKNKPTEYEVCEVIRLDSYGKFDGGISLIKVDVEGMELEVLRGSENILKKDQPILLFETLLENFSHDKIKELEKYLRDMDYAIFAIDSESGKLRSASYPNLDVDSIAVHKKKISNFPFVPYDG